MAEAPVTRATGGSPPPGAGARSRLPEHSAAQRLKGMPGIAWATIALFAAAMVVVPDSLASAAVLSMLPVASITAIAAVGQTLVIQQRGLDLSVPGAIALGALIATRYPGGADDKVLPAVLLAIAACGLMGLLNGLLVSVVRVAPFVATLAMNAVAFGAVQSYSGGVPSSAPSALSEFGLGKSGGVPNTVLVAVTVVAVAGLLVARTVCGRRFTATGANPAAARASGVAVGRYVFSAYLASSVLAGIAGVLLAGYLNTPALNSGDSYLLATVAAVVLGGTPLSGGRGSMLGTAIGVLFLAQLVQIVLTLGAPTSVQLLIQAFVIGAVVGLRRVPWRRLMRRAHELPARRTRSVRPDAA